MVDAALTRSSTSTILRKYPLKLEKTYTLTTEQLTKAKTSLDNFLRSVQMHPEKREGAYPYYLLHKAGENVYGTVLLFHGFTNRPDQCWRLAQYLFDNGFNVYQPCIAAHYLLNPDKNWPQVDLKPLWKQPIRQKLLADPVLSQVLNGIDRVTNVTEEQLKFVMQRVNDLSPDMGDIITAINTGDYNDMFNRFYDSSHMRYLQESEIRLEEVQSLPGPILAIGLSVGGTVALGLAATHPDKIAKVVATQGRANIPHLESMYKSLEHVPHPMLDPTEVSQGMTNKFWATLYQETFRFLTEGHVNNQQLHKETQDPLLPQVLPVN